MPPAGSTATGPPGAGSTGEPTSRGRVLVVDDDVPTARGFGRILTSAGFTVTLAHDGKEAAAAARVQGFDVILSDIAMPGMNGIELLRAVREHDLDVPVILITGGPAIESAVKAMEYGALLYLIKPIEAQQLEEVITRGVRLHQMARLKREALELFHIDSKALDGRAGCGVRLAPELRAPRARGGQGRHVPDPGPGPVAHEAEAAVVDRHAVPRAGHPADRRGHRDRGRARHAGQPGRRPLPGVPLRA